LRGIPTKFTINEDEITVCDKSYVAHFIRLFTDEGNSCSETDRRLTRYEILKEDKFWQIGFNYFVWAIPIIIGIMGLMLVKVRLANLKQLGKIVSDELPNTADLRAQFSDKVETENKFDRMMKMLEQKMAEDRQMWQQNEQRWKESQK
jgi:hypothetical protein